MFNFKEIFFSWDNGWIYNSIEMKTRPKDVLKHVLDLAAKLMLTRRMVGTNTVSKLLMMGLPRVTSATMASVLWTVDLYIRILLMV